MSTQSTSAASQLLKLAVPLVTKNGFRTSTLIQASKQLPGAPTTGYTLQTINALYPSPPPANSRSASLFGSSKSLSRSQIIAEAQGRLTQEERVGPAKALLEAWLLEGRRQMVSHVHSSGLRGEAAIREGLRDRLSYNAPVLDNLVEALALLGVPDVSALSAPSTVLPFSSPGGHLEHVARIAHDLAKATGDESQGVSWYAVRTRLSTIYGFAESHLLSPSHPAHLSPSDRLESTYEVVDRLLDRSRQLKDSVDGASLFAQWVGKSWAGMFRSAGL